jgi:hypothetical protein
MSPTRDEGREPAGRAADDEQVDVIGLGTIGMRESNSRLYQRGRLRL